MTQTADASDDFGRAFCDDREICPASPVNTMHDYSKQNPPGHMDT